MRLVKLANKRIYTLIKFLIQQIDQTKANSLYRCSLILANNNKLLMPKKVADKRLR